MTDVAPVLVVAVADHQRLLDDAVERSIVLRQVMRLALQKAYAATLGAATAAAGGGGAAPGIGEAQFYVLHVLAEMGDLTVGDIAERCHVSAPTVSKMLNHLEANGLVERRIVLSNRRAVRVVLTEAGRAAHADGARIFKAALAQVLDPLADGELRDLIAAFGHLEKLIAHQSSPR